MYNFAEQLNLRPGEVIGYLRKSRTDDPTLSVEEVLAKHESILDEWAEKHLGAPVPENNKYREIVSGETIADRPEIQKVLKLIESPKIKAILTVEVQRISRGDLEDAGRIIKLLRYTNTLVITPPKTYNLSDEYDRDMFERELKRGNEFLEYQKKIMGRGRLLSVSQGNYLGSIPPYGYEKVWVTEGKRKCPTLDINREQAEIVQMIFDLYVNKDMGAQNICNYLDKMGIQAPKGENWSPYAVREMLSNVHYIGKVKWNWRKTVTVVEDSEILKTRPKARAGDYLIYDGKHQAIVTDALFSAAQEKQGRNHRAKSDTKVRNPLAGLVYCKCGRAMTLRMYKNKDGKSRCAPRLICDNQVHCHTGSCTFDEIMECVRDVLKKEIADFEIKLKNEQGDSAKLHGNLIKTLEKKLRTLEAKELAQWEAQANPDPAQRMPPVIFKRLNEKLLKEKEETEQALKNACEIMPHPARYQEKLVKFRDALSSLQNPDEDAAQQNKLLKACIERIDYNREAPERIKRESVEKKVSISSKGERWTSPNVYILVKLKV